MTPAQQLDRRRIWTFLAWTFGICWAMVGALYAAGIKWGTPPSMAVAMAYMLVPGGVVIALARRWGVPLREYGLRWQMRPVILLAPLLPVVLTVLSVVVAVAVGWGHYQSPGALVVQQLLNGLPPAQAEALLNVLKKVPGAQVLVLAAVVVASLVAGLTVNLLFALGEELGWRGLLQRELAPLGFARSSLLIGAIWGLWHAPIIIQGHNYPQHPLPGVGMMVLWCMALGVVASWLRLRAGTVLAPAALHGTINAVAGFAVVSLTGGSDLLVGLTGLSGIITVSVVATLMLLTPPRTEEFESGPSQTNNMEVRTDG